MSHSKLWKEQGDPRSKSNFVASHPDVQGGAHPAHHQMPDMPREIVDRPAGVEFINEKVEARRMPAQGIFITIRKLWKTYMRKTNIFRSERK